VSSIEERQMSLSFSIELLMLTSSWVTGVVRVECEERNGKKSIPVNLNFCRGDFEEEKKRGSGREEGASRPVIWYLIRRGSQRR